jgi:hypothetical protein
MIIIGFCFFLTVSIKQNVDPQMTKDTSQPRISPYPELPNAPEDKVIASFGRDGNNPERTIFLENPALLDAFINALEKNTGSDTFPKGPVLAYVKDRDGSIVVLIDPEEQVNQTVVNEIYSHISEQGRAFNITNVPCKFIRMAVVRID